MKIVQKTPLQLAFGCLLVLASILPSLASDADGAGDSAGPFSFTTRNLQTVPCGGIVATFPQETISKDFDTYVDATSPDALMAIGLKFLFANYKTYGVQIRKVCASCDSMVKEGSELYEDPSFDHYCGEGAYGHDLEHSGLVYLPLVGDDVRPGTMPGCVYSRPTMAGK